MESINEQKNNPPKAPWKWTPTIIIAVVVIFVVTVAAVVILFPAENPPELVGTWESPGLRSFSFNADGSGQKIETDGRVTQIMWWVFRGQDTFNFCTTPRLCRSPNRCSRSTTIRFTFSDDDTAYFYNVTQHARRNAYYTRVR